jgi:hypothetical protein
VDDFLEELREEFADDDDDDDDAGNGDEEADRLMSLLKGTLGGAVECIVRAEKTDENTSRKKTCLFKRGKTKSVDDTNGFFSRPSLM